MLPEYIRLPDKWLWSQVKEILEDWTFRLVKSQMFVPAGAIMEFGGTVAPDGFVLCNGQEYDQVKFPDLYKVVGTHFGGTATTFMVPTIAASHGQSWIIKV